MAATTIHSRTSNSDQAQTIRALLDTAASVVNTQYARVLSAVIDAKQANLHRTAFGFSALRDWLISTFDFTHRTASDIAAIARLSTKFRALVEAAVSGQARIDQVAYAVRQLDRTPAMRLFALTPFRIPVASPFDADTLCATPEHLIAQYCQHAPFKDLQRHLDDLAAHLAEESELLDSLGEQSLQWIELAETDNGMWALSGELSGDTGRLLDKYLKTACPPPRQDEQDLDGVLPAQPNRHAEALHQLIAGYGTNPDAVKRHGHTATLDLMVDIETLQGKDTGRTPLLEGQPVSVAKARLMACEAGIIPGVFDYDSGEAIELGRAARLPNQALRRKLELEQGEGCAWSGCSRPVAWTEAHHIQHWADGGDTNADNLILLCRFHHGRIHTAGWTVEKTGPGQALITHHDHTATGDDTGATQAGQAGECGCSDWRTDADLDTENQGSDWDVFPTGLYRTEWSNTLKPDLDSRAEQAERQRALASIRAARAKCRTRFTPPAKEPAPAKASGPTALPPPPPPLSPSPSPSHREPIPAGNLGDPPF
ncbi:HNH endonuclease signature motif containing protein [Glycomyces artemisiae]|uniref:HNH endonuclease n=1 Tax=Glycomyces artemisiae TaxID=1076443 RepID=A0A2T0UIM6_9ACTN|nr:HNH endonuclease signature motif containing protein [Glycomyces artemisiae]PRY57799.1 HNH endonuclease [Glycomyces artemisiae]